jgi:two-component system sensor kinase FixL
MDLPAQPPAIAGPLPAAHEDFVRRLGRRYFAVVIAVAALVAADQAVIQPMLIRLNVYAPAINLAGRQRMLSQRIAKASLAMQAAPNDAARTRRRDELRQALAEWTAAHLSLTQGDAAAGITPIVSPDITVEWLKLEPHFQAMRKAAAELAAVSKADAQDGAAQSGRAAIVVENEAPFLTSMDRIVKLMEHEAAGALRRLRTSALVIAAGIVALVVALGWFVIRPATRAIRGQVDELESQVARRTSELHETLETLRVEIAEREATESRNKSLSAQLAHADRVESMGHLAAGLAHELNQPLAAIANYAEAMRVVLDATPTEQNRSRLKDFAAQIQQASLRAGGIVRRIRNFVRPGANPSAPADLAALLQEVIDLCRPETARAEVELAFENAADGPVTAVVDAIQIQQVVVNLVQNAVHAMAQTAPDQRQILVQMSADDDVAQVDVCDRGCGLLRSDAEMLFAPFQTTKPDGLGIGLPICRSIIEHHQGTIWARSIPTGGAQFSFTLPLAPRYAERPRPANRVCR